jgi:hypothetical protein
VTPAALSPAVAGPGNLRLSGDALAQTVPLQVPAVAGFPETTAPHGRAVEAPGFLPETWPAAADALENAAALADLLDREADLRGIDR